MTREMICIECPLGCALSVDVDNSKVTATRGNKCPKGEAYAESEVQDPRRILTSAVLCEGLGLKFLPVRTDKPVPKAKLLDLMQEVRSVRLKIPVEVGDIVKANLLDLGVNLIATRRVVRE
jgi:CxxC motif-containing protein